MMWIKTGLLWLAVGVSQWVCAQEWSQHYEGVFHKIKVIGRIEVELIPDGRQFVELSGNEEMAHVSLSMEDGVLTIKTHKVFRDDLAYRAAVHYDSLAVLHLDGGAEAYSREIVDADPLELKVNTGASFEAEMAGSRLEVLVSEGGQMALSGTVSDAEITANTGAQFLGAEFSVHNGTLKAGTGGQITIKRVTNLNARANTGGQIVYLMDPNSVELKTNTGGVVRKE